MITYGIAKNGNLPVYLDGLRVGTIKFSKLGKGFYYKPNTGKRGAYYLTSDAVKRSIEQG